MNYLPNTSVPLSYILLVFALFQGVLLLVLVYLFLLKLWKSRNSSVDTSLVETKAYSQALSILEDSKKEALTILDDSYSKAHELLSKTSGFLNMSKKDMRAELDRVFAQNVSSLKSVSDRMLASYRGLLASAGDTSVAELGEATKELKGELAKELKDLRTALHEETAETELEIRQELKRNYEEIRKDLDAYKKEKLALLEKSLYSIAFTAVKDLVGVSLTVEDHEEIVKKVLEKASREGVFEI